MRIPCDQVSFQKGTHYRLQFGTLIRYTDSVPHFAFMYMKVKELVRGTQHDKEDIVHVLRAIVYAKSRVQYDALKILLAKYIGRLMDGDDGLDDDVDVPDENDVFSESDAEGEDSDKPDLEDDDFIADVAESAVRDTREDDDVKRGRKHPFYRYILRLYRYQFGTDRNIAVDTFSRTGRHARKSGFFITARTSHI